MAGLTIRSLDDAVKTAVAGGYQSRLCHGREAARKILRRALMAQDKTMDGLGSRVHQFFFGAEADGTALDLVLPARTAPRAAPDFVGPERDPSRHQCPF